MSGDDDAALNEAAYRALLDDLAARRAAAREGGGAKAQALHRGRGKLTVRERIDALLDPGSPFLELADLAGAGLHEGVPPGAGLVTGIGAVSGRLCMLIANDATVKGGTYFGITCKKHVRALAMAWQHRLPCITLVDSGGAFLPDQARIFPDEGQFGSIFHHQVRMSAEGIAQIAVVMGACTAGGAYIPALADELVIVRGQGFLYLGGPQLTQAATGEAVEPEALGGAQMHSTVSGVADHLAEDDAHALAITRRLVARLGDWPARRWQIAEPRPPRRPEREIYRHISRDARHPSDNREVLLRLLDDSAFDEFKPLYGTSLVTGFAELHGYPIGILANHRGVLFSEEAEKAAQFIQLANQIDTPLVFLQNTTGYMVGKDFERRGIIKDGAKMINAVTNSQVPHLTINMAASYGAGNYGMCGRAFGPRFLFTWPNAKTAVMGPQQLAGVMSIVARQSAASMGKPFDEDADASLRQMVEEQIERESLAMFMSGKLYDDGIIDPRDTRTVLGICLSAIDNQAPAGTRGYGVYRM